MTVFLPRLLYLLAALAWYLLLWPNQVTIFMAACFSCLTLPYYRNLRRKTSAWRVRLERTRPNTLKRRLLLEFSHHAALFGYITTILSAFFVPIATLALLVSPQAAAGLRVCASCGQQLPTAAGLGGAYPAMAHELG